MRLNRANPPSEAAQPWGVLSYYATAALSTARSMDDWLARIESHIQQDVEAGYLPVFYRPNFNYWAMASSLSFDAYLFCQRESRSHALAGRTRETQRMIQVPLYEVKNDLSRYLRIAEKEGVIITRHGVPAGILIGFADPEDWWEEALLRHPQFQARIARARQSAREGKGIPIEQLRAELNIDPPIGSVETEIDDE